MSAVENRAVPIRQVEQRGSVVFGYSTSGDPRGRGVSGPRGRGVSNVFVKVSNVVVRLA